MQDNVEGPVTKERLIQTLTALRRRVDWMWLFPAFAAIAWGFGQGAVAMVLAVVLPVFMALQGGSRMQAATPPARPDATGNRPMHRAALQAFVDDVLADCAQRDLATAVLQVQIEDLHLADGEWGTGRREAALDRLVQRVGGCVRGQDAVIRSGDTCLTLVLTPTHRVDLDMIMNVVDRVQAGIAEPVVIDGRALRVRSCVGICSDAMAPARTGAAILAAADCALRIALRQGEDSVRIFNPDLQAQVETGHKLGSQVEMALRDGSIRPWFQPQIHAATGRVAGFEALARWHHPELGVLTPDQFLNAIEAAGLLGDLGDVMLRASLDALVAWDDAGLRIPRVGINISLSELSDPRLAERLCWQVDRYGIATDRIAIEILETVTLRDGDEAVMRNVDTLRKAGFHLDLDDFGTGAASIAHIARFGVNRIKLDRSFILGIEDDPAQRRIVEAILKLAETLQIDTLAEGVETAGQRDLLTDMGCPLLQGFGIARPMPFEDTLPWARADRIGSAAALHDIRPQGTA